MRIAYACLDGGIPAFGRKGASVHVQGVVAAMRRAGHDVVLLAARLGDDRPAWAHDLPVHHVALPPVPDRSPTAPWISAANAALFDALDRQGPVDLVYERYSLWSFGGMEFARHRAIPGVLEVNAPLIEEQAMHRGLANRVGAERVAGRVFAAATTIVAVSEEVADYVNRHPCTATSALVEANGFDPDRFPRLARREGEPFTLGFLGTLKAWHGLGVMVDVLERVRRSEPRARLLVIGDGPERPALEARLDAAGMHGAVTFTGAVAPDAVAPWLAQVDVALAPYPADAPFYFSPLKVVEYMAAGVPVVASAIGQIPALVRHGVTGVLVPPGDAAAFAEACLALRDMPARRRAIAEAARHDAMTRRTWDAVVERILAHARRATPTLRESA